MKNVALQNRKSIVIFTDDMRRVSTIDHEESPIHKNSSSPVDETNDFRPNFTNRSMMRGSLVV